MLSNSNGIFSVHELPVTKIHTKIISMNETEDNLPENTTLLINHL